MGKVNGKIGLNPELVIVYYASEVSKNEVIVLCLNIERLIKAILKMCYFTWDEWWVSFQADVHQASLSQVCKLTLTPQTNIL